MKPEYSLELGIFFESKEKASAAFKAILPETGQKFEKRSKTSMEFLENSVFIKINSLDKKSLLASASTYIKLFLLSEKISEVF